MARNISGCWYIAQAEGGEQPPAALPPSRSMAPSKERGAATLLYNAMISPLARYTLGGVVSLQRLSAAV